MADIIFGAIAAFFGGMVPMQLLFGKAYTFDGFVDREHDPERYWTITLAYAAGSMGALLVIL